MLRARFGPRTKGGPEPNGQRETRIRHGTKWISGQRSCGFVVRSPSIAIDWSRAKKEARSARAEAPRRGWQFLRRNRIVRRMIRPWRIVCGALVEYWFSARVVMFLRRGFSPKIIAWERERVSGERDLSGERFSSDFYRVRVRLLSCVRYAINYGINWTAGARVCLCVFPILAMQCCQTLFGLPYGLHNWSRGTLSVSPL